MLVGVCDFPGEYAFPPHGYGGIERWLWAVAVSARAAGAEVHLLGPQWRAELAHEWTVHPTRFEEVTPGSRQARSLDAGYDLLVVGHEYPSLPAWRAVWEMLDTDLATFQHWPYFQHQPGAFDGVQSRLYCYSDEMCQRFAAQRQIQDLAVHLGLGEIELPARDGDGLLWMGRIDQQKAPTWPSEPPEYWGTRSRSPARLRPGLSGSLQRGFQVLERLSESCATYGIQRDDLLPLHGLHDAELTFSAVQALDPHLKHHEVYVYARGFVPQPAIRFTGPRDEHRILQPGFATSFVNVSIIEPTGDIHEHVELIDVWVGVLSRWA